MIQVLVAADVFTLLALISMFVRLRRHELAVRDLFAKILSLTEAQREFNALVVDGFKQLRGEK